MAEKYALAILPSLLSCIADNGHSLGQILTHQAKARPKLEGLISEISIITSIVPQLQKLFKYEADVGPFSDTILQDAVRTSDQCAIVFTRLQENFKQHVAAGKGKAAAVNRRQISWLVARDVFSDLLDQLRNHRACFTNLLTYLTNARLSKILKTQTDTNRTLLGIVSSSKTSNADLHCNLDCQVLLWGLHSTTETNSEGTIPVQYPPPNQNYGEDDLPHLSQLKAALNLVQADVCLAQKMVEMREYAPSLPLVASLEQLAPLLKPLLKDRSTLSSPDAPSTVRESTDLLLGLLSKEKRENKSGSASDSSSESSDSNRSRRRHRRFRHRRHNTRSPSTSSASSETSSSSDDSFISVTLPPNPAGTDPISVLTDTPDLATPARNKDLCIPEPPCPIYPPAEEMPSFDHGIAYREDDRARSDLSQLDKIANLLSKGLKLKSAASQLEAAGQSSPFDETKLVKLEAAIQALCDRQVQLSTSAKQSDKGPADTERHNWSLVWDTDELVLDMVQQLPSKYRPFWPSRGDPLFSPLMFPPLPLPPMGLPGDWKKARKGRKGKSGPKEDREVLKKTEKRFRNEFKAGLELNKKDSPDLTVLTYDDLADRWAV